MTLVEPLVTGLGSPFPHQVLLILLFPYHPLGVMPFITRAPEERILLGGELCTFISDPGFKSSGFLFPEGKKDRFGSENSGEGELLETQALVWRCKS